MGGTAMLNLGQSNVPRLPIIIVLTMVYIVQLQHLHHRSKLHASSVDQGTAMLILGQPHVPRLLITIVLTMVSIARLNEVGVAASHHVRGRMAMYFVVCR